MERTCRICFGILLLSSLLATRSLAQEIEPLGQIFNYWNGASSIVINHDYAFVACRTSGVQVVNIRDPYELTVASVFDNLRGPAEDVELAGSRLYVQTDYSVEILSTIDQPHLIRLGVVPSAESIYDFSGAPNFLAISNFTQDEDYDIHANVIVYAVNDPENPVTIDSLVINSSRQRRVLVRGTKVIVEADTSLMIYEINENYVVEYRGYIPKDNTLSAIDGRSDYIVVGYAGAFEIWNVVDPRNPELASRTVSGTRDLRLSYPYLTTWRSDWAGFSLYDITDPFDIDTLGGGNPPAIAGVASDGSYCYVADGFDRLYSLTYDGGLAYLFQSRGYITDVELTDERAYVSLQGSGYAVIDISRPERPSILHEEVLNGWTESITVREGIVFTSGRGLHIFDTNAEIITEIGSYVPNLNTSILQTIIDDTLAYLLLDDDENPQIDILDIRDLRSPRKVGNLGVGIPNGRMVFNKEMRCIYIAGSCSQYRRDSNFAIIDVIDPSQPVCTPRYRLAMEGSYHINDIAFEEEYLALSLEDVGVFIYDASNQNNPTMAGEIRPSRGGFGSVAIHDRHLYAGSEADGLTIYDLSDLEHSRPVANRKDFVTSNRLKVRRDGLAALSTGGSLKFYDTESVLKAGWSDGFVPVAGSLLCAYPNPFNDRATIRIDLPTSAPMQLMLFDVSGRQFGEWTLPGGLVNRQRRVFLDGGALPSGMLYLKAKSGERMQSLTVLHLK